MTQTSQRPRARHYKWRGSDGNVEPVIRIDAGKGFAIIDYHQARRLVDQVHDLCDEHERQQREEDG